MVAKAALDRLRSETDPERTAEIALELLRDYTERQAVDLALLKLKKSTLGDSARVVLCPKTAYYLDHPERDSGCNIREALIRLLVEIGNPADLDLYLRGVAVHEQLLGSDVAQNLRAASLVGIGTIDPSLASVYATRLLADLADTSRFSGEPAITAMNLLHEQQNTLPICTYLMMLAQVPASMVVPEVESKALELLDPDFPAAVYRTLALPYIESGRVIPQAGIVSYIAANRRVELYDLLETIVTTTRQDDLHRYTLIEIAASRHRPLIDLLYRLAATAPAKSISNFVEAVNLTLDPRRDDVLAALVKRRV